MENNGDIGSEELDYSVYESEGYEIVDKVAEEDVADYSLFWEVVCYTVLHSIEFILELCD